MKTASSLLLATSLLTGLQGCDQRAQPTNNNGGNGSDTFVPDVEAARARNVTELKKHPKPPDHQQPQNRKSSGSN